jgi:hypothetical protein
MLKWLFIILLILAFELYTFQAVKTITSNNWILAIYGLSCLGILLYFFYGLSQFDRRIGVTRANLQAMGALFLLIVPQLILLVFMLSEDISRAGIAAYRGLNALFGNALKADGYFPDRRDFISKLALGAAAIPLAGIIHGMFKGKYNFRVIRKQIFFEDLPESFDGFTLTQISDIHSGSFDQTDRIAYAMDLINEQNSDLLVFTGDLVNNKADEMIPWVDTFNKLKKPKYGKYSILGNHDYGDYIQWDNDQDKAKNLQDVKDMHAAIDFKLLCNDHVYLDNGQDKIALVGVENWGHRFKKMGDLKKASEGLSKDDFKVLLSHDPSHWEHEVRQHENDYHLTLSGHTHGSQFGIEIPGFIKWSPVQYVYKYWGGLYQEFGKYLYVNRGFGFHAFPGRVGIWPEITVLELKRKTAS